MSPQCPREITHVGLHCGCCQVFSHACTKAGIVHVLKGVPISLEDGMKDTEGVIAPLVLGTLSQTADGCLAAII
jgi:hypothetical protein